MNPLIYYFNLWELLTWGMPIDVPGYTYEGGIIGSDDWGI